MKEALKETAAATPVMDGAVQRLQGQEGLLISARLSPEGTAHGRNQTMRQQSKLQSSQKTTRPHLTDQQQDHCVWVYQALLRATEQRQQREIRDGGLVHTDLPF